MKKLCPVIICLMMFKSFNVDAQYKIYKEKYDYRHYIYKPGDPYNPSTAAFASIFIPGLGQMICGEGLRGTGFLFGCAGSLVVSIAGLIHTTSADESDSNFEQVQTTSIIMWIGGLAGAATFWIWSIADAPRVARVKNLALRDKKNVPGKLSIQPYFKFQSYPTENKAMLGLSVDINF
jgi:hypothetical protein